jgi:hypothetical protein
MNSDPTKDPKFQQVVQTFLRTPPKPHRATKRKRRRVVKRKAQK